MCGGIARGRETESAGGLLIGESAVMCREQAKGRRVGTGGTAADRGKRACGSENGRSMDRKKSGTAWEAAVAGYLQRAGVNIRERNFRCSQGEIDIIGYHQGCLVFFEVKYRRDETYGTPAEAVGREKQNKICRCADYYLYTHAVPEEQPVRFDVVAVCGQRVSWIRNAFDYRRRGRHN